MQVADERTRLTRVVVAGQSAQAPLMAPVVAFDISRCFAPHAACRAPSDRAGSGSGFLCDGREGCFPSSAVGVVVGLDLLSFCSTCRGHLRAQRMQRIEFLLSGLSCQDIARHRCPLRISNVLHSTVLSPTPPLSRSAGSARGTRGTRRYALPKTRLRVHLPVAMNLPVAVAWAAR